MKTGLLQHIFETFRDIVLAILIGRWLLIKPARFKFQVYSIDLKHTHTKSNTSVKQESMSRVIMLVVI